MPKGFFFYISQSHLLAILLYESIIGCADKHIQAYICTYALLKGCQLHNICANESIANMEINILLILCFM